MKLAIVVVSLIAASAAGAQSLLPSLSPTPAALQIFERDWVLMNWALKYYDADRDIMLQPSEAQAAGEAFWRIADTDGDGQVTTTEYRDARAFILARY
jgi:hypothetical protein